MFGVIDFQRFLRVLVKEILGKVFVKSELELEIYTFHIKMNVKVNVAVAEHVL